MHPLKQGLRAFAAASGPVLLILLQPALVLVQHNTNYFLNDLRAMVPFLQLASLVALSAVALYLLRQKSKACAVGLYSYFLLAPLWMAYIGLQDITRETFYVLPLLAVLGGYFLAHAPWREAVITGFAIFGAILSADCAVKLGATLSAVDARPQHHASHRPAGAPAAVQNNLPDIYHVVFDEFQSDLFAAILNEETRHTLSGFTWYKTATTPFGRTEMALASMFTGMEYSYQQTPHDYIKEAFYGEKSLLTRVRRVGYRTIGYLHETYPAGEDPAFETAFFHGDLGGALSLGDRQKLLVNLRVYNALPPELYRKVIPQFQLEQLARQTLLPNDAPYISLQSFQAFLEAERKTRERGGRYIFLHLLVPHFPTVLRADCGYTQGENTDIIQQTQCAVKLMDELVSMLKEQGRFKDALLYLHGDHGAQYIMKDGEPVSAKENLYSHDFSLGRSRPLVLLKPAGVDAITPLVTDDRSTDLFDYYPTVLETIGAETVPLPLTGHSLLQTAPQKPRARTYHFYDKDKSGKNRIVDGVLHRYLILPDGDIAADREIAVPLQ